ncbi:hypothetical protein Mapa_010716 [Marchantia paleacea]|nr:hypothetical protein Mapa_010716 [Marchantia paleacea]
MSPTKILHCLPSLCCSFMFLLGATIGLSLVILPLGRLKHQAFAHSPIRPLVIPPISRTTATTIKPASLIHRMQICTHAQRLRLYLITVIDNSEHPRVCCRIIHIRGHVSPTPSLGLLPLYPTPASPLAFLPTSHRPPTALPLSVSCLCPNVFRRKYSVAFRQCSRFSTFFLFTPPDPVLRPAHHLRSAAISLPASLHLLNCNLVVVHRHSFCGSSSAPRRKNEGRKEGKKPQ